MNPSRTLLVMLLMVVLSACESPIDLTDPYDRIQGEPGEDGALSVDAEESGPAEVALGNESGGAGGDAEGAAGGAE